MGMADMIVLKCDIGSKAATVICPECGRISRQILKTAYANGSYTELMTVHTCPVCGTVYHTCNSTNASSWNAAFARYRINADSYNTSVKEDYAARKNKAPQQETSHCPADKKSVRQDSIPPVMPSPAPVHQEPARTETRTMPSGDTERKPELQKEEISKPALEPERTAPEQQPVPQQTILQTAPILDVQESIQHIERKPVQNTAEPQPDVGMTAMDRKIDRWKKELLDTGKRNKMINYRESKRQTLRILEPGATELFNQLAVSEKELTFQQPISKDSDFRTYSMLALLETLSYSLPVQRGDIKAAGTIGERDQTLKNMRSKTKLAQEEQGANILYLCFGFIIWRESSRANATWIKSPLLMMPVSLGLKSLNAPYTLSKYDDEIEVNPTLDYLFNQDYGIDLPTFELKNKNSFEEYMEAIEELVDKRGWKLVREVSLGLLSFLKISMYHDLNNNRPLIEKSPVIQAISGNRYAIGDLPPEVLNFKFDDSNPMRWHEVVDSDSSQQEAILLSKKGISFVMQGPPGTGKSQTITNIIAEALADGKKVLFVSEKSAALQVVLKRLTEVQLDDFCLSLHNYKANKKEIIDNIGANLRLGQEYVDQGVISELTELFHDRKYLDEYAEDLHRVIEPFGESVYMVFGKLLKLQDASVVEFRMENPTAVSREQYSSLLYMVDAFEKALHNMDGALTDNPWTETSATASGQTFRSEMTVASGRLPKQLGELETAVLAFNHEYNTEIAPTWNVCTESLSDIETALALPLFPAKWRDPEVRTALRQMAVKEDQETRSARAHAETLGSFVSTIDEVWSRDGLCFSAEEMALCFSEKELWNAEDLPMSEISEKRSSLLETAIRNLTYFSENYQKAVTRLHLPERDRISDILMASRVLKLLVDAPQMDEGWFDVRNNTDYVSAVKKAKSHRETLQQKTDKLLEEWEPDTLNIDADGMLARFKTEYTGMFYKFKGTYKADIKHVKLLSKTVGKQVDDAGVIALLQAIGEINIEKRWFTDNEARLKELFPNHYIGLNTDWSRVLEGLQTAANVANQFPYANIPSEVIDAILENARDMHEAAEIRKLSDCLEEEKIQGTVEKIREAGILPAVLADGVQVSSLLEELKNRLNVEQSYQNVIYCLNQAKQDGKASYADLARLLGISSQARQELRWFTDNHLVPEGTVAEASEIKALLTYADTMISRYSGGSTQEKSSELEAAFGTRYTGLDTNWQGIIGDLDTVAVFESETKPTELDSFLEAICEDGQKREAAKQSVLRIRSSVESTAPSLEYFKGLFPKTDMTQMPFHEISAKYEACLNHFGELNKWLDYVETRSECDAHGLQNFTAKIAAQNNAVHDVRDAFERGFYTQWLAAAIDDVPAVQTFRRRIHEQRLEKFASLDTKQFELSRSRIRDSIIRTFPSPNAMTRRHSERGILMREMEKKRRIMPLRKLFHEIPNLLLTLKPCLMMSPLSVAYFLNAEDYHFDMVIFDEASQIFPQDAIGAIFRADQVIIAGDTKQLPPTNFFSASTSNSDDDYNNEDNWEEDVYDSILEETANVLPNRTLLWHYRSKHEHLIAFSNQEIYRSELVTFPSSNESEPDTGVEFVYVEEGYYEGGGRNCNILEAKRCMELVKDHIDKHPGRSLGIIAFSEKQQQAIALEIQRFREKNPEYEEFFKEGKDEEFFVKNLENVQGDERDTIFFSVGYAKTKEQKANGKPMAMRFGPLGVSGGERRLNVAITRAKINVKLVSSIMPSDIDLNRTESEGIRMLRSYIEFAMNGEASLAAAGQTRVLDDFADSIYRYITRKGYKAKQYVGCSGYKIDIAVEHPEIPDEFIAGIECDGVSYASARTARDRDRLRRSVLKDMGWNLYRVWSTEWYRDPEVEGQKLIAFIEKAVAESNERIKSLREQRAAEEEERKAAEEKARRAKEREEKKRQQEEERLREAEKAKAEEVEAKRRKAAEEQKRAEIQKQAEAQSWAEEQKCAEEQRKMEERQKAHLEAVAKMRREEAEKAGANGRTSGTAASRQRSSGSKAAGVGIYGELVANGFDCIDNRATSSIIWVIYQADKKAAFESIAEKYHAKYKLEKRGAVATGNKAAWRIMS